MQLRGYSNMITVQDVKIRIESMIEHKDVVFSTGTDTKPIVAALTGLIKWIDRMERGK